jgi:hypothetical protein
MLIKLNEKILANTPVWEGDTILNWRWSTRMPDLRHEDPRGIGIDPGPTNTMPLGERAAPADQRRTAAPLAGRRPEGQEAGGHLPDQHLGFRERAGIWPAADARAQPRRRRQGHRPLAIAEVMAGVL